VPTPTKYWNSYGFQSLRGSVSGEFGRSVSGMDDAPKNLTFAPITFPRVKAFGNLMGPEKPQLSHARVDCEQLDF
jgi:hypothetical protein